MRPSLMFICIYKDIKCVLTAVSDVDCCCLIVLGSFLFPQSSCKRSFSNRIWKEERFVIHIYTIHLSVIRPKVRTKDELIVHKTLFQNLVTYLIDNILGKMGKKIKEEEKKKKLLSGFAKPFKNTDQSELSTAGHQELLTCSLVSLLL